MDRRVDRKIMEKNVIMPEQQMDQNNGPRSNYHLTDDCNDSIKYYKLNNGDAVDEQPSTKRKIKWKMRACRAKSQFLPCLSLSIGTDFRRIFTSQIDTQLVLRIFAATPYETNNDFEPQTVTTDDDNATNEPASDIQRDNVAFCAMRNSTPTAGTCEYTPYTAQQEWDQWGQLARVAIFT